MPTATVSQETVHKDLRTCPGGYVELKALPYGKLLSRREMASKMSMGGNSGPQDRRRRGQTEDSKIDIEVIQEAVRYYEFRECIVDHNLTDSNDRQLNFTNKMDFQMLNPKIGQEIEGYIDELNQEDEEVDEDFTSSVTESSHKAIQENTTKK